MLAKRVIQVKLTVISESESGSLTAYVDTPLWRVESAETRNGKTDTVVHSHYPPGGGTPARERLTGTSGPGAPGRLHRRDRGLCVEVWERRLLRGLSWGLDVLCGKIERLLSFHRVVRAGVLHVIRCAHRRLFPVGSAACRWVGAQCRHGAPSRALG
jgi:hypothetical protein